MDWQEILMLLIPILGLMVWVYNRIEKKADDRLDKIEKNFKEINLDLKYIDQRLARLEGKFDERGFWISTKRTGTQEE